MHTTNYHNTFIEIAEDCPVTVAETPLERANPTIATIQYEMIAAEPYRHTSDDVIFHTHATRKGIAEEDLAAERERYFSKGQACLRTSPLARRYGWGIHHDAKGRVALVAAGSDDYRKLAADAGVNHTRAMRSKRA